MRGLAHFWKVTPQDNLAAQALLERAIAIDPHYGQALGLLALSYVFGTHMGWKDDRAEIVLAAERAALAAVRADNEDACAHLALAAVYVNLGRYDDSLAEFELALRLNRNMSLGQGLYGLVLSACGRWKEGSDAARRALRLSPRGPLSAIYHAIAAYAEFVGRNYDEAIRLARESVRQRFDFVGAHRILTAAAGMSGETDLARAALRDLRRVQPGISLAWMESHLQVRPPAEREHYLEAFRRAGLE
jgi:tetratricopeptide (TPR) repeat protein